MTSEEVGGALGAGEASTDVAAQVVVVSVQGLAIDHYPGDVFVRRLQVGCALERSCLQFSSKVTCRPSSGGSADIAGFL